MTGDWDSKRTGRNLLWPGVSFNLGKIWYSRLRQALERPPLGSGSSPVPRQRVEPRIVNPMTATAPAVRA